MSLIDIIKKSRETSVEAGGYKFTVRRPTDLEVIEMRGKDLRQGDIMQRYVVDWDNVREIDIIPGGNPVPVPFDTDLFMEWIADQPDLWNPLTKVIVDSYNAHQDKLDDALKKQEAG